MSEEDLVLVTFEVIAEVLIGETVCICGDHPTLGSFQVKAAPAMTTDPMQFPLWKLTIGLPRGLKLSYHYLTTGFNNFIAWEPNKEHRKLDIPQRDVNVLVIRDRFGVSTSNALLMPPTLSPSPVPFATAAASNHDDAPLAAASNTEESSILSPPQVPTSLMMIGFHLPVNLYFLNTSGDEEVWEASWDLDNPASGVPTTFKHKTWIGAFTPHSVRNLPAGDDFFHPSPARIKAVTAELKRFNVIPLFLTKELYTLFYVQFCKEVLWDVFHNVLVPRAIASDELSYESGYVKGNQAFADLAKLHLTGSEIVWVHDYHLMLLPKFLDPNQPTIFFLHVPFPTSEIFRVLPMRQDLLAGMLSSSSIGFHTFNHARHFFTCCRRFLGAQSRSYGTSGALAVEYKDRRVLITVSYMGLDLERFQHNVAKTSTFTQRIWNELHSEKNLVPPKFIFGSLDDLQRLKGVYLKLLAFERFMELYPSGQFGSSRFVLWTISGGTREYDLEISTEEVRTLVKRINSIYGTVVVHREFDASTAPTAEERMGLWLAINVLVNTAVSEGLNMLPLEFTLCKRERPGVVILSEFSACASLLNGAIQVNCYDIATIAEKMNDAALITTTEKKARYARDFASIGTMSTSLWAKHIIEEVTTALEDSNFTTIEPVVTTSSLKHFHMVQVKPLNFRQVVHASANAQRRVFFTDFGGTLVENEQQFLSFKKDFLGGLGVKLSDELKDTLTRLCQDERNLVFIVSMDTRTVLTRVFYSLLSKRLGLVSHSGLYIRFPTDSGPIVSEEMQHTHAHQRELTLLEEWLEDGYKEEDQDDWFDAPNEKEWKMTVATAKWDTWMEESGILSTVKLYEWTTAGSKIRLSSNSMTWDYTFSDPEFGLSQAQNLVLELETIISQAALNVMVKHTKNTVQLLPSGVDKGLAVAQVMGALDKLKPEWNGLPPDFCLALGDGTTDELMFSQVHQYFTAKQLDKNSCFTATVGRKHTSARSYVRDSEAVGNLLMQVADGNMV